MSSDSGSDRVWMDDDKDVATVSEIEVKLADDALLAPENRAKAERRLVRLLDLRLLPTVILIYLMNYIDVCTFLCLNIGLTLSSNLRKRNAITAARVEGLQKDLNLTGKQTNN